MKTEVRNRIFIALLVFLGFWVLTFALTQARYSEEKDPDNHTGELEYTLANQLEVTTTEQFFAAIENGYSNIKIADAVSNPFLVSGSADVTSDLIMDLNGHEIQRNSREPMLTVKEGVKMIVTDTSKSQTGSFYNPVGSVLKVDGGVLTVMSNKFESGPRDDEFYSNRDKNATNGVGLQYIGGKINQTATLSVTRKQGSGVNHDYVSGDLQNVPIILPYMSEADQGTPIIGGKKYFVNGNIYFNDYTALGADIENYNSELINKDTYIYFTIDDQNASTSTIVASTETADFHYSYYVYRDGASYKYRGPTPQEGAQDIKVTIYGYHNVIASARNEVEPYNTTASNFAAIKMVDGSMHARGGEFYSYFGVETASCIYADEGVLSVYDGTYTALDEGVAVKCNYLEDASEFTISGGSFKSFKGDTIQMTAGEMTITGGTFVKDSQAYTATGIQAGFNENNSAINLSKGTINLKSLDDTPINFYLAGHYMAAIECGANAIINSEGVNYQFGTTNGENTIKGGNNVGILSQGGDVDVINCTFIQPGDYSFGIYSYQSENASNNTLDVISSIFSMGGERCKGIYANGGIINIGCKDDLYKPNRDSVVYDSNGEPKKHKKYVNGNVKLDAGGNPVMEDAKGISIDNYTMFYLDHVANCYGVFVEKKEQTIENESATTQINVYSGQFSIGSGYDSTGERYIKSEIPGSPRLDGNGNYIAYYGGGNFTTEEDLQKAEMVWSAGVYLNDPDATVSLGRARMIVGGSYAAGIFAEKGKVDKLYNKDTDIELNGTAMAENDLPTTVLFIGTRMLGYNNGGYLNQNATEKSKKWNHLYKRDYDYYQTRNFTDYYDRIVNCNSTDDYGIAAKAGSVTMGRAYVNVRSKYSRGIYATSDGSTDSKVTLDDLISNIDNSEENGSSPNVYSTTIMTIRNGNVEINNGDVRSNSVGIVINNGKLTFTGDIKIEAINASAIYMTSTAMVSGGISGTDNTWTVAENAKVSIFCNIRERSGNLTMPTPWKLKNVHSRGDTVADDQLPVKEPHKTNIHCMLSHNGMNIKGGSFVCDGELVVDFHGVNNENQSSYDPYSIPLSSCAINVEKMTSSDAPDVKMWHIHVTSGKPKDDYVEGDRFYANKIDISDSNGGGGISVNGGDVYLGKQDDTFYTDTAKKGYEVLTNTHGNDRNELITIETFGNKRYRNNWDKYDYLYSPAKDNWSYAVSQTGGPGIKVEAGNITVKHGTYYAAQGNGIVLNGGEATVEDGIFKGKNTEWTPGESDDTGSGLGSYYGFMLRGGGSLTINKGTFEGMNGGAFVVGSSAEKMAVANVYGGTFEDLREQRSVRTTTNGFSVGPYSTVTIGKETDLPKDYKAPKILGVACGIAVENNGTFKNVGLDKVKITIQGGSVIRATKSDARWDSNINAIWKGNTSAEMKFGECTLLLQEQNITTNEKGELTVEDGNYVVSSVILNESTLWKAILDPNTYHAYEFPDPPKDIYEVDYNWQSQGAGCYKVVVSKTKLDYPKWQPSPFKVIFNTHGHGETPAEQKIWDGGYVTKPENLTEEGWTFCGWYEEADYITKFDFQTYQVKANCTLHAKWIEGTDPLESYTVSFDNKGHGTTTPDAQVGIEYGGHAANPGDLTEDKWIFGGWYEDWNCTTAFDFATREIYKDTIIYAKWMPAQCTVTFNMKYHGTAPESQTIANGNLVTKPQDPTEEGWTFGGWYTDWNCYTAFDFATPIKDHITLYAKWTEGVAAPTAP